MKEFVNYEKIIINNIEYARGVIYMFKNKINNKCYIGLTLNEQRRYKLHLYKNYGNIKSIIDDAIRKYGIENFEYSILFTSIKISAKDVKTELNKQEKILIKLYNTLTPNGYNITIGGSSLSTIKFRKIMTGRKATEETKRKMSLARKGKPLSKEHLENCKKAAARRRGIKCDALILLNKNKDHIEKVKKVLIGKKFTKEHLDNVNKKLMNLILFYKNNIYICTYNSLKECVESLKNEISKASICRILHGKYVEKYKNYKFLYEGQYHKREKLIEQYDINNIFIKQWKSLTECKKANLNTDRIKNACKNNIIYANSYWKYSEPEYK